MVIIGNGKSGLEVKIGNIGKRRLVKIGNYLVKIGNMFGKNW